MEKSAACGDKTDNSLDEFCLNTGEESIEVLGSDCILKASVECTNRKSLSESLTHDHINSKILDETLIGNETSPLADQSTKSDALCQKYVNGEIPVDAAEVKELSCTKPFLYSKKEKQIWKALKNHDVDFLKKAAISKGGLLSDDIRKKVWPMLVGMDVVAASPCPSDEEIEAHYYHRQVRMDVDRSLKRFPPSIKEAQKVQMLEQLVLLIMRVLCKHPNLHYYQGYHDICVTFLLVLGEEKAFHVVDKLSQTHLSRFMAKSMDETLVLLNCMFPLIEKKSPELSTFLKNSEVGVAYCVSWLITWFGHVLNDYDTVVRLFDFFLVSHYAMPLYLTAAIVLYRKEEVLKQDCDMASVHSLLSNIPDDLPFEKLLTEASELFDKYDLEELRKKSELLNDRLNIRKRKSFTQLVVKRIRSSVPFPYVTIPMVIAGAIAGMAVLYQAYYEN